MEHKSGSTTKRWDGFSCRSNITKVSVLLGYDTASIVTRFLTSRHKVGNRLLIVAESYPKRTKTLVRVLSNATAKEWLSGTLLTPSLFWDVTHCGLVLGYRRFETACWSQVQESSSSRRRFLLESVTIDDGTGRLS
jgi:hypothetical protein